MFKWIATKLGCLFKGHKYKRQEIGPLNERQAALARANFDMETREEGTFVVQHICENCNYDKEWSERKKRDWGD